MKEIRFVQTGTTTIIILIVALIICMVLTFVAAFESPVAGVIMLFATITILFCLATFYRMTIGLNDERIFFSMGIGIVKKSYPLSTITSCKPVKSPLIYGIGIRMIPGGWLYSVSGFSAIELTFNNRKSIIRIGTDKAEMIAAIINERIGGDHSESIDKDMGRKRFMFMWIFVSLILILPILFIIKGNHDTRVTLTKDHISIKGMYGFDIRFDEIVTIDTLPELPRIKTRTNGFATGKYLKGNFRLQDKSNVKLFVRKKSAPYIHITTDKESVYLNSSEDGKVEELYDEILNRIKD
jgi:hypothetical protein